MTTTAAVHLSLASPPRLLQLWRAKLVVTAALLLWVCVPYYGVQYVSLRPAYPMPVTAIDRAVPFDHAWAGVYLSLYLLIPLAPLFYTNLRELKRFAIAMALTSAIAFAVFLIWPTTVPRPALSEPSFLYDMIVRFDRPLNACPSLHAAFAVLAVLAFEPLLRDRSTLLAWSVRVAVGIWMFLILYATLATRQHVLIDLLAGTVLGAGVWFACRRLFHDDRAN